MFLIFGLILTSYLFYRIYQYLFPPPNIDPNGKFVLISGCDTGFGHSSAIELDKQGFHVLAGVYKSENISLLKDKLSPRATVFPLDITKSTDIDVAYDLVKEKTNVLHALVNNAGIGTCGFIDWVPIDSFKQMMEVNFYGQVAMIKKFLPLLIVKPDCRIVNICSVMGFTSPPNLSAYCASKHAFEAFSDCLRREMFSWNLRVCIIEPGWIRTPIIQGHDRLLRGFWTKNASIDTREQWGDQYFNDVVEKSITNSPFINNAEDPMKVVRTVRHAVMNSKPNIRYHPDWQATLIFYPASFLPAWLTDFFMIKLICPSSSPESVHNQLKDAF